MLKCRFRNGHHKAQGVVLYDVAVFTQMGPQKGYDLNKFHTSYTYRRIIVEGRVCMLKI